MATTNTQWILELIDRISKPLKSIDANIGKVTSDGSKMNKVLTDTSAVNITAVADSFRSLKDRLNEFTESGVRFQDGLADVEAITGISGDALDSLGIKARSSAKKFGGDAADSLENYKVILSKLGPDIGKSELALDSMNSNVLTLSKTMGGDTTGAVDALTTSMLQFRVDLTDPIKASKEMTNMMNVMAAGAQQGSAEVPQVSAAIKNAGVAASQANVSFVETNAAIQELARGGKVGAEGGVALRNVLGKMAGADVIPKAARAKLQGLGVDMAIVSDTTLPLTTRLRELGKAQGDATAFSQVFGTENAAAAAILTRSADAQDALQAKIQGTNTATEQAEIKMATFSERMSRANAWTKDLGISMFNATEGFLPLVNGAFGAVDVFADLKNAQQGVSMIMNTKLGTGLKNITSGFKGGGKAALKFAKNLAISGLAALKSAGRFVLTAVTGIASYIGSVITATAAQWGLNVAMNANPIGLIVLGVAAAIGAIVLLVKNWDWIKQKIIEFTKFIWKISPFKFLIDLVEKIFPGFKQKIKDVFATVMAFALEFWNKIKEIAGTVASFFGFGDDGVKVEGVVTDNTEEPTPEGNPLNVANGVGVKANVSKVSAEEITDNAIASVGDKSFNTKSSQAVSQVFNITNNFSVAKDVQQSLEDISDKVIEMVTRRLRDPQLV